MSDLPPGSSSSSSGSSRLPGRPSGGLEQQLEDALQRIAALEERLARYEATIAVNADGSVDLRAEGQFRIAATNNLLLEAGANYIELGLTGIDVAAPATLRLEAGTVRTVAAMVQNNAAMVENSGVLRCETLIATSVVAASYTPGAGNVW